jgi:hypothetical protein
MPILSKSFFAFMRGNLAQFSFSSAGHFFTPWVFTLNIDNLIIAQVTRFCQALYQRVESYQRRGEQRRDELSGE